MSTREANHHEVTLVQLSFDFYMLEATPAPLMGNIADDIHSLDATLKEDGMDLIASHCSTRKLKNQDGRCIRCYGRQWLKERFIAWLQWKPWSLVRWEYYASKFRGFVQLTSFTMLLKRF